MPALKLFALCCLGLLACNREGRAEQAAPPAAAPAALAPTSAPVTPLPQAGADAGAHGAAARTGTDTPQPPIWSVAQLRRRQGLPTGSKLRVRGHVVRLMPCPPCPPSAKCKPCSPALDFAERADSPLGDAVYLRFLGSDLPSVDSFRLGEEYVFAGTLQHWVPPSTLPFAYLDYTGNERSAGQR